jgi:ATP:ADP antiporter, AAA family
LKISVIYELFTTIFDYHFKINAAENFSGTALTNYLNIYGSSVNLVSLVLLLIGVSKITNKLGIIFTLVIVPVVSGLAIVGFLGFNLLSVLFALMITAKSLNYSVNTPAIKRLFIPTSSQVRYKAQTWIETLVQDKWTDW